LRGKKSRSVSGKNRAAFSWSESARRRDRGPWRKAAAVALLGEFKYI